MSVRAGYPCGYVAAAANPATATSGAVERLLGASPSGSAFFTSAEYPSYSPLASAGALCLFVVLWELKETSTHQSAKPTPRTRTGTKTGSISFTIIETKVVRIFRTENEFYSPVPADEKIDEIDRKYTREKNSYNSKQEYTWRSHGAAELEYTDLLIAANDNL